MLARREDVRRKIALGGLVIKARLEDETTAVLLGALLEVARSLKGANAAAVRARFQKIGHEAFLGGDDGKTR